MKISKDKLQRIVREEMARLKRRQGRKTIRISEGRLRKMIREELSEMQMVDPYDMPGEESMGGGCPGAPVDKHGSLANPPQEPLEQPPEMGSDYHHPAPGMEWEAMDEEDDVLLGMEGY